MCYQWHALFDFLKTNVNNPTEDQIYRHKEINIMIELEDLVADDIKIVEVPPIK